jgi:hypothetical protein
MPIKTAGANKGRVERLGEVGGAAESAKEARSVCVPRGKDAAAID